MNAIIKAETLEQFVENATALVAEGKLRPTEEGLDLRAVDPANVGMLDQSLSAAAFESYESGENIVGINLERLSDVLGMADSGELAFLEVDRNTRKLHLEIGQLEYTLSLIDPSSIRQEPDIPGVEDDLGATLVCEAKELGGAEKAADLCSDHIAFGASVDSEVFYAEAQGDTDDMRFEWERDETLEGSTVDADAHSMFSLDYVSDVLGPLTAATEVSLHVGESYPMFLDSSFADGEGELRYMVAPRVDSQ